MADQNVEELKADIKEQETVLSSGILTPEQEELIEEALKNAKKILKEIEDKKSMPEKEIEKKVTAEVKEMKAITAKERGTPKKEKKEAEKKEKKAIAGKKRGRPKLTAEEKAVKAITGKKIKSQKKPKGQKEKKGIEDIIKKITREKAEVIKKKPEKTKEEKEEKTEKSEKEIKKDDSFISQFKKYVSSLKEDKDRKDFIKRLLDEVRQEYHKSVEHHGKSKPQERALFSILLNGFPRSETIRILKKGRSTHELKKLALEEAKKRWEGHIEIKFRGVKKYEKGGEVGCECEEFEEGGQFESAPPEHIMTGENLTFEGYETKYLVNSPETFDCFSSIKNRMEAGEEILTDINKKSLKSSLECIDEFLGLEEKILSLGSVDKGDFKNAFELALMAQAFFTYGNQSNILDYLFTNFYSLIQMENGESPEPERKEYFIDLENEEEPHGEENSHDDDKETHNDEGAEFREGGLFDHRTTDHAIFNVEFKGNTLRQIVVDAEGKNRGSIKEEAEEKFRNMYPETYTDFDLVPYGIREYKTGGITKEKKESKHIGFKALAKKIEREYLKKGISEKNAKKFGIETAAKVKREKDSE
ncbi:MAG: hypothetical protein ACRDE2_00155 [Chitinophagaceae bacterium]